MINVKKLFWILFLLNLLNYIDRQVLYAVFPLLQADLHLTDLQLGTLASAFMLVYMCVAPVIGLLAGLAPRRFLIGASALLWSAATWSCGLAGSYRALVAARGLIGVGEAGFTTLAQPFLAEHYAPHKRATLLALFGLALPLGGALGYFLGGLLGSSVGWRGAFMWVGLPGILLGLLALAYLKDPPHRLSTPKPACKDYKQLLTCKPFIWICLAHAMITFIMGGLSAWMPTYFTRYLGFSVSQAAAVFGVLVVVCGAAGTYAGGRWADGWLKKYPRAYFRVIVCALAGLLVTALTGLLATCTTLALVCFGLAIVCVFIPTGPVAAILVNVTQAPLRAMAFAVNIFIIHLLGDALSPTLIGWAADRWSLKTAVLLCALVTLPGSFFCIRAAAARGNTPTDRG